jgi:hypothetical protein
VSISSEEVQGITFVRAPYLGGPDDIRFGWEFAPKDSQNGVVTPLQFWTTSLDALVNRANLTRADRLLCLAKTKLPGDTEEDPILKTESMPALAHRR